jgi:phosphoserine phosphatase
VPQVIADAEVKSLPPSSSVCREKLEADRLKTLQELEEDRAWMRDFLAREAAQIQAEQALRDRQREELRLWLEALKESSKAEELVRRWPHD